MTINPDATWIPDQAEVWFALKADVDDITTMIPPVSTDDLEALGWEEVGLIDDKKGIPLNPSGEVREYDAFGYPNFRTKFKKGKLKSGFTALEWNSVTRKFVLPGSTADNIGIPRDIQGYLLYRFTDEDRTTAWVQLRPALIELVGHGGIIDGELQWADLTVHHSPNADRDAFKIIYGPVTKVFTLGAGVTAYTATVNGETTASISTLTSAALQTALRALTAVGSSGVTVTGSGTGPFTAVFTVGVSTVTATGTGGTVTVTAG
jgi:hypothetical protein